MSRAFQFTQELQSTIMKQVAALPPNELNCLDFSIARELLQGDKLQMVMRITLGALGPIHGDNGQNAEKEWMGCDKSDIIAASPTLCTSNLPVRRNNLFFSGLL
jgi:hypothetical protein